MTLLTRGSLALNPGRGTPKSGGLSITTLYLRGDLATLGARGTRDGALKSGGFSEMTLLNKGSLATLNLVEELLRVEVSA